MRRTPGTAVVTGGAGFVGSWLCQRLLADGHEVWCVDSFVTGGRDNVAHLLHDPRFHLVVADVCDPFDVPGEVDLVLHLASPASPVHYLRMPVETLMVGSRGTTNALDLAERKGARFLMASTSEVYGDPLEHPQRETYWGNVNPIGPRSVYDEAKRFSEALTTAYREHRGVDTVIARIFNTYGPRMADQDGRVVPTFVHQALAGEPLTVAGDGSQTRSLCFVEDTVDGLLRLAASGEPGPVNIGNDQELTVLQIAELITELTGSDSRVDFVDLPTDDPKVRRPDIGRAEQLLGWRPSTPVREGLSRTVRWMAGERTQPATA
ncbi:UDP-glucuronic acid decarboxylase family protein [Nocardioides sp. Arc9.136]|uniref:UDP-glucuronic acid decarboxylase family protein n=1 Tax=Nocardioides sp. Arc9.136 TaxID=2996826 RepID=UPI002665F286|nr:UDP-glucuronic acid decarboxylase family protein [Nocardioides sp. Arc9.136]WKN46748.1 SDR family oxidoreductase [Nocardioides sp. Arc9.136]